MKYEKLMLDFSLLLDESKKANKTESGKDFIYFKLNDIDVQLHILAKEFNIDLFIPDMKIFN